jgi:hypothetical protein
MDFSLTECEGRGENRSARHLKCLVMAVGGCHVWQWLAMNCASSRWHLLPSTSSTLNTNQTCTAMKPSIPSRTKSVRSCQAHSGRVSRLATVNANSMFISSPTMPPQCHTTGKRYKVLAALLPTSVNALCRMMTFRQESSSRRKSNLEQPVTNDFRTSRFGVGFLTVEGGRGCPTSNFLENQRGQYPTSNLSGFFGGRGRPTSKLDRFGARVSDYSERGSES